MQYATLFPENSIHREKLDRKSSTKWGRLCIYLSIKRIEFLIKQTYTARQCHLR